ADRTEQGLHYTHSGIGVRGGVFGPRDFYVAAGRTKIEATMSQPNFQTNLSSYLWDLVDEGIDEALDRIQGQTGVTGLAVDVHCPPVQQIRPHAGVAPRTFRTHGGAQFQPDPACLD